MDDAAIISELLLGVTAHGLWGILLGSGKKGIDSLKSLIKNDYNILKLYDRAASEVLTAYSSNASSDVHKLAAFLKSPEPESCCRQLFSSRTLYPSGNADHTAAISDEFRLAFIRFFDSDTPTSRKLANDVFGYLIRGCDRLLSLATDHGILAAHERLSSLRHRLVLDELTNIKASVQRLAATRATAEEILTFEQSYRAQVASRHSHITPPHLDVARKIPIDELYTKPRVSTWTGGESQPVDLSFDALLSRAYRFVLLGQPGGGKSTFALKLCHDLSNRYEERLVGNRALTPILVILREYGAWKKETPCSLAQFITQQATSRYQLADPPLEAFEYLFSVGRVLVIFDGLDELLDTGYRQEISADVESFCNLYPSVPVIVTSREVGYGEAPLDEGYFDIYKLAPFSDAEVTEYARKWFGRDRDATASQQLAKAKSFISESKLVPDLRSNPLMLGLMCSLYYVEGYIPRNRPELYEKCSIMLFERWDKGRGIVLKLSFDEHIRPALQYIAFTIYSHPRLQNGVTHRELVDITTQYLSIWVFEDKMKAGVAAREFIDFCTGRAWVFADTGTTADGERLFQFTHRTFLEYFTSVYLVAIHAVPEVLCGELSSHILRREWDVVSLLSFQILSRRVQGGADALVDNLMHLAETCEPEGRWNILVFAARSLDVIVPTPKSRRVLVTTCVRAAFERAGDSKRDERTDVRLPGPADLIGYLLLARSDNRETVVSAIESELISVIKGPDRAAAVLATELSFHLRLALHRATAYSERRPDVVKQCVQISSSVHALCRERILLLALRHPSIGIDALRAGMLSHSEFVASHKLTGLFRQVRIEMFQDIDRVPQIVWDLDAFARANSDPHIAKAQSRIADIAAILREERPPWSLGKDWTLTRRRFTFLSVAPFLARITNFSGHVAFVGTIVLATLLQLEPSEKLTRILNSIESWSLSPIREIRWILLSRFRPVPATRVQEQLESLKLNSRELVLLNRWSSDRESFVQITSKDLQKMLVPVVPGTSMDQALGTRTPDPEELYSGYEGSESELI
jgi:hypothetical protein